MYIDKKQLNNRRTVVRNSLRRDLDAAKKYQRDTAISVLNRANNQPDKKTRVQDAIIFNVANISHKVLGAFGVSVPIRVNLLSETSPRLVTAWTDFSTLYVNIKPTLDLNDMEQVSEFIYTIKGAVYHEGGHVKFTWPFDNVIGAVSDVKNTSNDYAKAFAKYQQCTNMTDLRRAWNIIEDQSMEMAMVCESPVLARYYTATTINVVIDKDNLGKSWPYVTGRAYLDHGLRKHIRSEAKKLPCAHLITEIDSVVARYRCVDDHAKRFLLIHRFMELLDAWGMLSETHETEHRGRYRYTEPDSSKANDSPEDFGDSQEIAESNDGTDGGAGTEGSDDKDDGASDNEEQGDKGKGGAPTDESGDDDTQPQPIPPSSKITPGNGASPANKDKDDKTVINDILDKVNKEIKKQSTRDAESFVTSVNEAIRADVLRDNTCRGMKEEGIQQAQVIEGGIIAGIEHLLDQTSPSWRFRQESGVLDPTTYTMREPGETDYWSNLSDVGSQGYDLSISVMLDTSYSMSYQTEKLSVIAYAIRSACDELDVPCTVTTFNDSVYMLYGADEQAYPLTIHADGGTAPLDGLNQLDNQRFDKRRQLVFILTDGEWSDVTTLSPWSQNGRYFIVIGLGMWDKSSVTKHNPDAGFIINNLDELPAHFTRTLAGFLA